METIKIIRKLLNFIEDGNLREAEEMFSLLWKMKELESLANKN